MESYTCVAYNTSERDLGVIAQSKLKVDMQCNKAANRSLDMMKRNFRFKSRSVMLSLYKSIGPHLDYCVQAWRPHYRTDILISLKMCRGGLRRWLRGWRGTLIATD